MYRGLLPRSDGYPLWDGPIWQPGTSAETPVWPSSGRGASSRWAGLFGPVSAAPAHSVFFVWFGVLDDGFGFEVEANGERRSREAPHMAL